MNKIDDKYIDVLCFFVFNSIVFSTKVDNEFPKNLVFVFNEEDINLLEYISHRRSRRYSYYLYDEDISNTISILKSNLDEYIYHRDDNKYYIYIDDIIRFTDLIYRLNNSVDKEFDYNNHYSILNGVWIRMSPNGYDNIYKFIEQQILFSDSDYFTTSCFNNKITCSGLLDYNIDYSIYLNNPWYETNRKMSMYINSVALPEIYFSVIDSDNKKVCYLYAIQNPKNLREDNPKEVYLREIKKSLKNKYVNYKFILGLHIFIEIMRDNGIYDIKVPLLQLFNYDYHVSMSEVYKRRLSIINEDSYAYEYIKKDSLNVIDKQDIISKNKTERLIETFMMIESIYNDIDILNDPFIEDENLNIKVLKK